MVFRVQLNGFGVVFNRLLKVLACKRFVSKSAMMKSVVKLHRKNWCKRKGSMPCENTKRKSLFKVGNWISHAQLTLCSLLPFYRSCCLCFIATNWIEPKSNSTCKVNQIKQSIAATRRLRRRCTNSNLLDSNDEFLTDYLPISRGAGKRKTVGAHYLFLLPISTSQ